MQAVILAGGLGTRLRTVTGDLPKPLVSVCGEPFLLHQLRMLMRHGMSDFLFLISHRSDKMQDFLTSFKSGVGCNCIVDWNVEPVPMGTGGALKAASSKLKECFFLINGDSFLDMDYEDMEQEFLKSRSTGMLAVYDNHADTDVIPNVRMEGELIVETGCTGEQMMHVHAGVVALRSAVLDFVPDGKSSIEADVYPQLARQGGLRGYLTGTRFYDIGTPERFSEFEGVLGRGL